MSEVKGVTPMVDKKNKINETNKKRSPKGQRTHVRRLKQAAGIAGTVYK
jgi:hypothetical protein